MKVFKDAISKDAYKRMDEVYQVASSYIHKESRSSKRLGKARCFRILRDVRRTIYEMELLQLSKEQKEQMYRSVRMMDISRKIEGLITAQSDLSEVEKKEVKALLGKLSKGKLREESQQAKLAAFLSNIGGRVWEISKPVLTEVLTASIKKQYGIE